MHCVFNPGVVSCDGPHFACACKFDAALAFHQNRQIADCKQCRLRAANIGLLAMSGDTSRASRAGRRKRHTEVCVAQSPFPSSPARPRLAIERASNRVPSRRRRP